MPRLHRARRAGFGRARRRHRTWMLAMALASMGWGCWWLELFAWRFFPAQAPSLAVVGVASSAFALVGLVAAILALRGRNVVWFAIAAVPLFANLALLAVPFLVPTDFGVRT